MTNTEALHAAIEKMLQVEGPHEVASVLASSFVSLMLTIADIEFESDEGLLIDGGLCRDITIHPSKLPTVETLQ